ncbi:MAG: hypothetical protein A2622_09695 [Bdellovibrionales bacterium RIFCSPHIGHO2_01_FULL_40_29]|nr:MAG: hypothetical protein A2622_09695 [Bdellovibrionales bacterium RIFCSPHIGHO2_01_FULL_40_29]OFZ32476.1 MAG: hypothetical protein A3D17_12970 [Bdellovibrionales bacterium RIFCSPHIGHO2_02_FULL_40_15]
MIILIISISKRPQTAELRQPAIHHVGQSPKEGIDSFLKKHTSKIKIVHQEYQVIVKKIDE